VPIDANITFFIFSAHSFRAVLCRKIPLGPHAEGVQHWHVPVDEQQVGGGAGEKAGAIKGDGSAAGGAQALSRRRRERAGKVLAEEQRERRELLRIPLPPRQQVKRAARRGVRHVARVLLLGRPLERVKRVRCALVLLLVLGLLLSKQRRQQRGRFSGAVQAECWKKRERKCQKMQSERESTREVY
jgi:hypothetical protein